MVDCWTGVTLITGPSGSPSAAAYWLACALASATALALAAAISLPVSVRFSDTSLTLTALPPARTAALIWAPAVPEVGSAWRSATR